MLQYKFQFIYLITIILCIWSYAKGTALIKDGEIDNNNSTESIEDTETTTKPMNETSSTLSMDYYDYEENETTTTIEPTTIFFNCDPSKDKCEQQSNNVIIVNESMEMEKNNSQQLTGLSVNLNDLSKIKDELNVEAKSGITTKDTSILIILFLAVILIGIVAVTYNALSRKRKSQQARNVEQEMKTLVLIGQQPQPDNKTNEVKYGFPKHVD